MVPTLGCALEDWGIIVWFPAGSRYCPGHQNIQTGCGANPASYSV